MNPMKERLAGLLFLAIGGGLGWFCIYQPLNAAEHHSGDVSLSMKGVALTPMLLILGVLFLLFGSTAAQLLQQPNGKRKSLTPLGWIFTLVCIGAGLGLYFWMEHHIRELGYRF